MVMATMPRNGSTHYAQRGWVGGWVDAATAQGGRVNTHLLVLLLRLEVGGDAAALGLLVLLGHAPLVELLRHGTARNAGEATYDHRADTKKKREEGTAHWPAPRAP